MNSKLQPEQVFCIVESGSWKPLRNITYFDAGINRYFSLNRADYFCHLPNLAPEFVIVHYTPSMKGFIAGKRFSVLFIYLLPEFGQFMILKTAYYLSVQLFQDHKRLSLNYKLTDLDVLWFPH